MATFEICEIFSNYYFSYVQDYKATLAGGNYGCWWLYKSFSLKILGHLLKKQSLLKNLKSQLTYSCFLKRWSIFLETSDQFLFFQFFPNCSNVVCIIVCIFHNQINNNLLHENQFDFRINNSTEHSILPFTWDIAQNFDNSKFTLGVFIDLSTAFDTVDHKILLKKLKPYGVNEKNISLTSKLFFPKETKYWK